MNLKDTINMMNSEDYKERFKAEYYQLTIRIEKLSTMLSAWKEDKLNFTPSCNFDLLEAQLNSMKVYQHLLQTRAAIEGVDL